MRMGHDRAGKARRRDERESCAPSATRGGTAREARLGDDVVDEIGRQHDLPAEPAHRGAERMVVGERVGDGGEPADRVQRLAAQRDRRAETAVALAQRLRDQRLRQEAVIDVQAGETATKGRRSRRRDRGR